MMKSMLALSLGLSVSFNAIAHSSEKKVQNASYKVCHYKLAAAKTKVSSYPLWERKKRHTWQSCPLSWTLSEPENKAPIGVYIYLYTTYH
ncbi:hypothetical protein JF50_12750 [Pseudoalteromonas luteoviolacea]|uniref:Uncharacterized protein n=2 Tax=Pseudoalteromonas luteoviolacea TaxID=43657 RepID=A0A0C1Q7T5_9GAMM|nr:hypothetical protein JF50_12750 [Pseudoalteromonas luteoviolacea]